MRTQLCRHIAPTTLDYPATLPDIFLDIHVLATELAWKLYDHTRPFVCWEKNVWHQVPLPRRVKVYLSLESLESRMNSLAMRFVRSGVRVCQMSDEIGERFSRRRTRDRGERLHRFSIAILDGWDRRYGTVHPGTTFGFIDYSLNVRTACLSIVSRQGDRRDESRKLSLV